MTPGRALLILAVLLTLLFLIGFVLTQRQKGEPADLSAPWMNKAKSMLLSDARCSVEKEFVSPCRQGNRLVLNQGQSSCRVLIKTNTAQRLREVVLVQRGDGKLNIRYDPARDGLEIIDRGARPFAVDPPLDPGKPLKLIFLKHGGTLHVERASGTGQVILEQQ